MIGLAMAEPAPTPAAPPREVDAGTLARCKAGDPMAFRAFVVRYERAVFALLSRICGRGAHVEDLAQETFLRAFGALPSFDVDGAAKPSTWLLTIATRLALDAKKRRTFDVRPLDEGHDVPHGATPETSLAHAQTARAIERAAAELSDDQRAAMVLADFHGLSMSEIAAAVGVPEGTVKTRIFRAREHMRGRLAHLRKGGGT